MIEKILKERNAPSLMTFIDGSEVKTPADFEKRREEIKKIIQEKEYGYIPAPPDKMALELLCENENFCAGKAHRREWRMHLTVGEVERSFDFISVVPKSKTPVPAFVLMNFTPDSPDKYLPTEEITDSGFAVFSFHHSGATTDDGDFTTGVAPLFTNGEREPHAPGKIAMWAWCAMRVMDHVMTLPEIDKDNVAVIGHSRLGKTALVAGAFDERFKYVISNDSGCSGAALTRGKCGETVEVITRVFPFWFCPYYVENQASFLEEGYDQHFLIALSAPRVVMIGSAKEDLWADPESEFLATYLASEAWRALGKQGLISHGEIPSPKSVLDGGDVFYQVRFGTHYLSREDWGEYMRYIKKMMNKSL